MPTLIIGGESSFIGEGAVGGPAAFTSVGTLVFSGTASNKKVSIKGTSGQLSHTGTASYIAGRQFIASGTVTLSGAAIKARTVQVVAGTVVFSGTAPAQYQGTTQVSRTASGQLAFSATASFVRRLSKQAEGEFELTATSPVARAANLATAGSIVFSGVAEARLGTPFIASGSLALSGVAVKIRKKSFVPSGVMLFSSTAVRSQNQVGSSVWNNVPILSPQVLDNTTSVWDTEHSTGSAVVQSNINVWRG